MLPISWHPPIELSTREYEIITRIREARLFAFLRLYRHEVFDEDFQRTLTCLYRDCPRGQPPVPPALLALATILQTATGVSDDEVIEASLMDRRWQLVLNCVDTEEPPFCKGTLVGFRKRLSEAHLGQRLIERTVEMARKTGHIDVVLCLLSETVVHYGQI